MLWTRTNQRKHHAQSLSDNSSIDVSKSERNIIDKILLQDISEDVSENTITELKKEEHKELSVTEKVTGCFNIFECGRNVLDQLDVTYQRAFMATPEDVYYKETTNSLIKANNEGGKFCS